MLTVRMMVPSRHHIAIGIAEPMRKMCVLGIIGYWLKGFPIRISDRSIPRTGRDGGIRYFLPTAQTNSHYHPMAASRFPILGRSNTPVLEASQQHTKWIPASDRSSAEKKLSLSGRSIPMVPEFAFSKIALFLPGLPVHWSHSCKGSDCRGIAWWNSGRRL